MKDLGQWPFEKWFLFWLDQRTAGFVIHIWQS